ncbi:hypothetical protein [Candidatus Nitrosoglobus terrae]|uniref:hypothetical protein n=1 Tax=Candidatus Nitrosoglobus terrae TaxID=1630141 RepID=UPI000BBAE30F|nr:hypothetical protein [Candidatus Nitrosoglobus terrae]
MLFNLGSGGITAGAGSNLQGNFIAPDGFFALGSGLQIAGTPLPNDPHIPPPPTSSTTIPEPNSLLLMAFSLLILGFYLGQPKIRSAAASAAYASPAAV